ncbi:MAG: hypothetical protein LC792_01280 [Actinobacteria bacterium]|nr:hypothetical protein [Actinomycetota bacterium]
MLVLGMGRSGNSVVAAAVAGLGQGLQLPADDFESKDGDNPHGYCESRSLTVFNNRVLGALDGSLVVPPPPFPGWSHGSTGP